MTLIPENVQDYPRPPLVEPFGGRIQVELGGVEIVSTTSAWRVCETHHAPTYYIPPEDFRDVEILPAQGQSWCEWKGQARYVSLRAGGVTAARCAWCYDRPTERFAGIAGYFAIYPEMMGQCRVAGEIAKPQPGSFYGGWVTSNLSGIVKGGPGTEGW